VGGFVRSPIGPTEQLSGTCHWTPPRVNRAEGKRDRSTGWRANAVVNRSSTSAITGCCGSGGSAAVFLTVPTIVLRALSSTCLRSAKSLLSPNDPITPVHLAPKSRRGTPHSPSPP